MKRSQLLPLSLLVAALAACAANPRTGDAEASRRNGGPNFITTEEIQKEARSQHAYDLIRELRPNWLRARGVQSLGRPVGAGDPGPVAPRERVVTGSMIHPSVVYVNGSRAGGYEILRQILAVDLQEVRFLGATEATARFGSDHGGGAILLTTRQR